MVDLVCNIWCNSGHPALKRRGLRYREKSDHGCNPFHCAIIGGHAHTVSKFLLYGANVNNPTKSNITPLALAAHSGNLKLTLLLLQHGAKFETPTLSKILIDILKSL